MLYAPTRSHCSRTSSAAAVGGAQRLAQSGCLFPADRPSIAVGLPLPNGRRRQRGNRRLACFPMAGVSGKWLPHRAAAAAAMARRQRSEGRPARLHVPSAELLARALKLLSDMMLGTGAVVMGLLIEAAVTAELTATPSPHIVRSKRLPPLFLIRNSPTGAGLSTLRAAHLIIPAISFGVLDHSVERCFGAAGIAVGPQ